MITFVNFILKDYFRPVKKSNPLWAQILNRRIQIKSFILKNGKLKIYETYDRVEHSCNSAAKHSNII
jgi:hypothetical protein